MATKDWKKLKSDNGLVSNWENKLNKTILIMAVELGEFIETCYPHKKVIVSIFKPSPISFSKRLYEDKKLKNALDFAKQYMRTH
jgi:hypothetical protein